MEIGLERLDKSRIKEILVEPNFQLGEAIRIVDRAGLQLALVVDKAGKLVGLLSDGDVRRALLRGVMLEDSVESAMHTSPHFLRGDPSFAEAVELMRKERLRHLPILDSSSSVSGLFVKSDFTELPSASDASVLIMAGGRGSRLGEITTSKPKPMVTVGQKPILEIIIENCINAGFRHVFVSLGYRKSQIRDYFRDGADRGIDISYLEERKPLGTAGALSLVPREYDSSLVVLNGDVLSTINLSNLLQFHRERKVKATIAVRKHAIQIPFGVVETRGSSVKRIREKPISYHDVSAGMYVLEPEIFRKIPRGEYLDMPTLLSDTIEKGHEVCVFPLHEDWFDVGTPEDLEGARINWPRD